MEPSDNLSVGTWVLTTPDTVPIYSGVAYYFGKDLRAKLNRPVAIIQCAVGATQAEAWTPLDGLKKSPDLKRYVDSYDTIEASYGTLNAAYPAAIAAWKEELDRWNKEVGVTFTPLVTAWKAAAEKAQAANEPAPPQPVPSRPTPPMPRSPLGTGNTPSILYNGLVAPVKPYAIQGVIWYQGEFNAAAWEVYHSLLATMITAWRDQWAEGNFPFLIVELPRFRDGGNWPLIREAQRQTTTLPNVDVATVIDLGDPNNLHPTDKADVAHRLALVARHTAYHEKGLVWTGPIYEA